MRAGRRNRGYPISLFSFQDIITCLCGIMILITLLMAISISAKASRDPGLDAAEQADPVDLNQLRERMAELQEKLSAFDSAPTIQDPIQAAQERLDLASRLQNQVEHRDALLSELEIAERQRDSASSGLDTLASQIARLQSDKQRLESEIQMRRPSHTIAIIPGDETSKTPILIECSAAQIRVGRLGSLQVHVLNMGEGLLNDLEKHLTSYPPASHYVVFMIKPSGLSIYRMLSLFVGSRGYEVGYDVIGEESEINYAGVRR